MKPRHFVPVLALVLFTASGSCTKNNPAEGTAASPATVDEHASHDDEGHAGHGHGAAGDKPSDLDLPVDKLVGLACEHKMKTYECDECRYEVGVVKAVPSLFQDGLLKSEPVVRERIEIPLSLTGEVRFDERRVTHLSTQVEGIIRKVHVALGDLVKAGQPLLEIESVTVGEAEGAYLEAQATLKLAQRNAQRVSELKKESIASEKEYLQSMQELEAAEIRTDSAFGKLTRLGMSASDAKGLTQANSTGGLTMRAPTSGTVLSMHAVSGEVAKTEESLATLGDNASVWVWADLYERDIARVSALQQEKKLAARVKVKAYPDHTFPGFVDFINPSMEEASRTVKVRIEVNNPQGRLLSGMFANVDIFLPGAENALSLSSSAVLEDEGRAFVFIHLRDDYWIRRPVVPGRSWGSRVEILRGLKGDESVATEGAFLFKSDVLRSKMGAGCAD